MIDDCCFNPQSSQNWNQLQKATPVAIVDLIANATLGGTTGALTNSTNFANPGTWVASPLTISTNPTCEALGTDNLLAVANAAQWNFMNQTANLNSTTAIPLRKVLFLRNGKPWQMKIPIDFGGSTYTEVQLGFLQSAGTRGDAQGTYPVIDWTGSFTGVVTLYVTLQAEGSFMLGIWAKSGSNYSMLDMVWNVVSSEDTEAAAPSISPLEVQSFPTLFGGADFSTPEALAAAKPVCSFGPVTTTRTIIPIDGTFVATVGAHCKTRITKAC